MNAGKNIPDVGKVIRYCLAAPKGVGLSVVSPDARFAPLFIEEAAAVAYSEQLGLRFVVVLTCYVTEEIAERQTITP